MKLPVRLLQPPRVHMRVNLRRRNIGMPEHLLDDPQIRPALQQMRREGMSQHVRMHVLLQPRAPAQFAEQLPNSLIGQLPPTHR